MSSANTIGKTFEGLLKFNDLAILPLDIDYQMNIYKKYWTEIENLTEKFFQRNTVFPINDKVLISGSTDRISTKFRVVVIQKSFLD